MIVKNEEKHLAGCLKSVRDLVDEVVVVDTGSTDGTIDIARSFGAKVYHFDWINDFAAARNESLAHATGDWILYLDADERIEATYHKMIRTAVGNARGCGVFFLKITSQTGIGESARVNTHTYPRLFRRLPGIRFEGAVHEQIMPSVNRLRVPATHLDAVITHLGYAIGPEEERAKYERNAQLLLAELDAGHDGFLVRFNLGRTYIGLGRYDEGVRELEHALALPEEPGSNHLYANAHVVLAQLLLNHKQAIGAAIAEARKALTFDPKLTAAHMLLGQAYASQGQLDEAIASIREAITQMEAGQRGRDLCDETAQNAEAMYLALGQCLAKQGKHNEAVQVFDKALSLAPDFADAHYGIGESLLATDDYARAVAAFQRYLTLGTDDNKRLKATYGCAKACLQTGDNEQAERCLRATLDTVPGLMPAVIDLVGLLRSQKRYREAFEHLRSLPSSLLERPQALHMRRLLHEDVGQWRHVVKVCESLVEVEGETARTLTSLGRGHEALNQLDKALGYYERAVSLDAEYGPAWTAIGGYCVRLGQYEMAAESLRVGLHLGQRSPETLNNLGVALLHLGDERAAQRCFHEALDIDPTDDTARAHLRGIAASA